MPLTQEQAPHISKRSFYYDEELNKYLETLKPPSNIHILKFGTVERNLEKLETYWTDFSVTPDTSLVLLPVVFTYGRLTETFQKGTHSSDPTKMELLTDHSLLVVIDLTEKTMDLYDTNTNPTQRSYVKCALKKAIQRRLNISLSFRHEIRTAFLENGCSLSTCAIISMFLDNINPHLMEFSAKPSKATNSLQYKILSKVKSQINAAN